MFEHRRAQLEDIDAICALPQDATELFYMFPMASWPLTRSQMVRQMTKRNESTVILHEDKVIGYANIYGLEVGSNCFIGNVIIDRDHRNMGAARYLMSVMTEAARTTYRVKEVWISVFTENTAAVNLYNSLGFKSCGSEDKNAPDGRQVKLMHMKRPVIEAAA